MRLPRARIESGLAAVGVVLVLTSPLTYLFTAPANWVVGVKAGLGVLCLIAFAVLRRGDGRPFGRRLGDLVLAVAALALVVGVNLAARRLHARWDLTRERVHSLAPQTKDVLTHLPQSVRVVALVPSSHPSQDALVQLLAEYADASHGRLTATVEDPRKNPALAARYGLREGEMAVVLERADGARTALAAVSEAELTQALLRLSRSRGLRAYFVVGHGEAPPELDPPAPTDRPPLKGFSRALTQEGYALATLNLASVAEVPRDADVLVVPGPQTSFAPPEVERLERYLEEGGHLVLFLEPNGPLGLDDFLASWGIQLDPGVVAEPPAPGVDSPYVILTSSYGEHVISRVLRQGSLAVQLVTARALTLLREGFLPGVKIEPVVFSGAGAWEESQPDASPQPSSGEKAGRLVLGAASRRPSNGPRSSQARLFVLGEVDLVRDVLWGQEANRNLVLSAVAWAGDPSEGAVAIRPVDRAASSLELSPRALRQLRFWAVDVVPLTMFALAALTARMRRRT